MTGLNKGHDPIALSFSFSLSYRRVPWDSVIPPADNWVLPVSGRADLVRLTKSGAARACVAKVCMCARHD